MGAAQPYRFAPAARAAALLILIAIAAVVGPADAQARLEVRVLARVPAPGYPASAVVGADGTIYTATFKSFSSPSDAGPSKVLAYSPGGQLLRTYTVQGQTPGVADAVQVATTDRSGTLYLLDQDPARIVKLDTRTGKQTTWATFSSLPACTGAPAGSECSDGSGGNPPEPDFAAWGPDGSLYVTDYNQALIWRVPPTGGPAVVWLTDPALNGTIVGPAGIQLMADRRTLLLSTGGGGTDPATGKLYTAAIGSDGRPGPLDQLWESAPAEAPDGLAIARSGNIYVALVGPSGNAVVEVSPSGQELARVPESAEANAALTVPFDSPGSVTFDGENLIVANEASISNDSSHWALLEIAAGEPGLAPSLPPATTLTYRLSVRPAHPRAGRRVRFRFAATELVGGVGRPVEDAIVRFGRRRGPTGRIGVATITRRLARRHHAYRAWLIVGGRRVASVVVRTK